jgi:hypothetical protein
MTWNKPPGDGDARSQQRRAGTGASNQHHDETGHHSSPAIQSIDCGVDSVHNQPCRLVQPHHLRTYADVLRIYALTLANGLARTAALAPADSEAPAAFVGVEAWELSRQAEAIRDYVHVLAAWLEGQGADVGR